MFDVTIGDKKLRTHSLDRVARRLYGRNAVVIITHQDNGKTHGSFAVPAKRKGSSIFVKKQDFQAA